MTKPKSCEKDETKAKKPSGGEQGEANSRLDDKGTIRALSHLSDIGIETVLARALTVLAEIAVRYGPKFTSWRTYLPPCCLDVVGVFDAPGQLSMAAPMRVSGVSCANMR